MRYVDRDITEKFIKVSEVYPMVALVGPRQAGKTTFLKHMMFGKNVSYVLFDDPDAREIFDEDVKKFRMQYLEGYEFCILDEVQYCRDAGIKLKYLVDTGAKLWVTSSSEIILQKEVLSYLVGRVSVMRLYPFNLTEFLRAKNKKSLTDNILRRIVWEHMVYGGFPKVVLTDDTEMKRIILRDLYETMLLKDVVRNFSIEDVGAIERLVRYMAVSSGPTSYSNLSQMLDLSFQTVKKYIDALTKSYFIVQVEPFFTNKAKEITKQPKIYFVDTGLRNAVSGTFPSEPSGILFENYILSEMLKCNIIPKYWRTKSGAEVDFVIETPTEVIPVEIKITADSSKLEKGFRSFIKKYGPKRGFVVTYRGEKGKLNIDGCKVMFVDVLQFCENIKQLQ